MHDQMKVEHEKHIMLDDQLAELQDGRAKTQLEKKLTIAKLDEVKERIKTHLDEIQSIKSEIASQKSNISSKKGEILSKVELDRS